jgi:hypothetical protein
MSAETENKAGFDATLRCKAPHTLRDRFERLAKVKTKRVPELYREACVKFVEEQERALNLPPLTEEPKAVAA